MNQNCHVFSSNDIRRLLESAVGRTAGELDETGVFSNPSASKNKGRIGAVIEQSVFGYPADNRQEPDLIVDDCEWELKTTGLVSLTKKPDWRAKEPVSITAVSPDAIINEQFDTSAFWHKAERLLIVYYLYVKPGKGAKAKYASFEIKGYDFHTWHQVDRQRLEADWTTVRDYVRKALANDREAMLPGLSTFINPQLLYLDTSPKYPHSPRFRLKASLVTQMAKERLDKNFKMMDEDDSVASMTDLDRKLGAIASQCSGKTLIELANELNIPVESKKGKSSSKALAEQVLVHLFTGKSGKMSSIPLFVKAGLEFKTVVLTTKGGRTEDMKLNPVIDFDELCDKSIQFDDSGFSSRFTDTTIIVAVFKEEYPGCPLCQCKMQGFKRLWLGRYLKDAQRLWDDMRTLIFSNQLIDAPVLDKYGQQRITPTTHLPMSAPNWPKSKHGTLFVRGSSANAAEKPVTVNGVKMYRQNIWIKGTDVAIRLGMTQFIE